MTQALQLEYEIPAGHIFELTIGGSPIPELAEFYREAFSMPGRVVVDQAPDPLNILRRDATTLNDHGFLHSLNVSNQKFGSQ